MKKGSKKAKKAEKPTIWQALNEPVVEVSEEFGKQLFAGSMALFAIAWLMPYFGQVNIDSLAIHAQPEIETARVAGASISAFDDTDPTSWYQMIASTADSLGEFYLESVTKPISVAAHEVLDVHEPVQDSWEFLQPGVQAVYDAWLELMADPY